MKENDLMRKVVLILVLVALPSMFTRFSFTSSG